MTWDYQTGLPEGIPNLTDAITDALAMGGFNEDTLYPDADAVMVITVHPNRFEDPDGSFVRARGAWRVGANPQSSELMQQMSTAMENAANMAAIRNGGPGLMEIIAQLIEDFGPTIEVMFEGVPGTLGPDGFSPN